jgi:nucleotide-binding universal stress UspA family protein
MKAYQRILVPVPADGRADILLHRAAELAAAHPRVRLLALRVVDSRTGFESEGPAGSLPGDRAARRVPEARKRLDLALSRANLSWAEAKVTWGEPRAVLADVARDWSPDLVVACAGELPASLAPGADVLSVGCRGLFARLADAIHLPAAGHA